MNGYANKEYEADFTLRCMQAYKIPACMHSSMYVRACVRVGACVYVCACLCICVCVFNYMGLNFEAVIVVTRVPGMLADIITLQVTLSLSRRRETNYYHREYSGSRGVVRHMFADYQLNVATKTSAHSLLFRTCSFVKRKLYTGHWNCNTMRHIPVRPQLTRLDKQTRDCPSYVEQTVPNVDSHVSTIFLTYRAKFGY